MLSMCGFSACTLIRVAASNDSMTVIKQCYNKHMSSQSHTVRGYPPYSGEFLPLAMPTILPWTTPLPPVTRSRAYGWFAWTSPSVPWLAWLWRWGLVWPVARWPTGTWMLWMVGVHTDDFGTPCNTKNIKVKFYIWK